MTRRDAAKLPYNGAMQDFIISGVAARANRLSRWLMADPVSIQAMAAQARAEASDGSDEAAARYLIHRFARRAALVGFVTGLPSNPVLAFPLAAVDTSATAKLCADMASALSLVGDPEGEAEERASDRAPEAYPGAVTSFFIRGLKNRVSPMAVTKAAARWAAKRTVGRAVLTRMVPLVGGALGAAWNYAEIRGEGRRLYREAAARGGARRPAGASKT
ncbi:MAG: hypothetical protein R3F39_16295 [Myxococcota bacterium]